MPNHISDKSFNSIERDQNKISSNSPKPNFVLSEQPWESPNEPLPYSHHHESNEGKLIKKLGEKQKILEKYESLLKKVNVEFQNILSKNKELANQIIILETKFQREELKAYGYGDQTDQNEYILQRQIDELVLEKDEIQTENVSLDKILKKKNLQIEELVGKKIKLESKLRNQTYENGTIMKKETEWMTIIDDLKKKIVEKDNKLNIKSEDFTLNSSNCN